MGKSTRGAPWAAGFSLLRENSQSSVHIPLLTREIIQPLHTRVHTLGEMEWSCAEYNFYWNPWWESSTFLLYPGIK